MNTKLLNKQEILKNYNSQKKQTNKSLFLLYPYLTWTQNY